VVLFWLADRVRLLGTEKQGGESGSEQQSLGGHNGISFHDLLRKKVRICLWAARTLTR